MANLVLYRKYRPKYFSEVVGQEHIVQTLKNAVQTGLISHAYAFIGPKGSGKTTIARILAKAINCESASRQTNGEPCNSCASCTDINEGRAMDLIEIDAASNRGIDEIRELKEGIRFAPTKLKYKVFVVDEAHQLTKEAANALLKTLEEPPSHAIFILATTEAHKMIPTILSRCQRFDFRKLTMPEIIQQLQDVAGKEGIDAEKRALELIASRAGGALRDALSILDKVLTFHRSFGKNKEVEAATVQELLGLIDVNSLSDLLKLIKDGDAAKAIETLNGYLEKGTDPMELAKSLVDYSRHVLLVKINPSLEHMLQEEYTPEQRGTILLQAKAFEI
ncbi:MAG: DNA polymerase III subunit gamma/tau, partial [Candidatus Wildermuthbacteria bacterium]|nr:DNA polymerase III subunit gamma/tau [Candidatus Wildermuthbacteria bacterium]